MAVEVWRMRLGKHRAQYVVIQGWNFAIAYGNLKMHIDRAKVLGSVNYALPIRALEQIYFHLACTEQFFQRERVIDGKLHRCAA
jgi:hypothetical protein